MLEGLPGDERFCLLARTADGAKGASSIRQTHCHAIFADERHPGLSRVDAGTIELIRGLGVEVVTSADLVQQFEPCGTRAQLASRTKRWPGLRAIVDEAFRFVGASRRRAFSPDRIRLVSNTSSAAVHARNPVTRVAPIAAVNAHSADPHYGPSAEGGSAPIRPGDLVLIDLWAKQAPVPGGVCDITWTGFVGTNGRLPGIKMIFQIVRVRGIRR